MTQEEKVKTVVDNLWKTDATISFRSQSEKALRNAFERGIEIGITKATQKWIPVERCLPKSNVEVLAYYEWAGQFDGKKYSYICRASHIDKHTVLVDNKWADYDGDWQDYCEDDDLYYVPEGWYEECSQGNDDYMSYHIDATVTHWMPLPPAPTVIPASD